MAAAKRAAGKTATKRGADRKPTPARKRAADKAAASAKARGAIGTYGDRERRAIRDGAIVARYLSRKPEAAIAGEFGVSTRTVRAVVAEFRKRPSPLEQRPMEIVEEIAQQMRAATGEFEAMAARVEESMPHVALGARRAAMAARAEYVAMLTALGKLPDNLELFRAESELRRLGVLIARKLDEFATGKITAAEVQEFVVDAVVRRDLPTLDGTARDA